MTYVILKWVLVGLFAIGGMSTISMIGEPRKPITPGVAILTVVIDVIFIIWLLK